MNPSSPFRSWSLLLATSLTLASVVSADPIQVAGVNLQGGVPAANARVGHPDTLIPSRFVLNVVAHNLAFSDRNTLLVASVSPRSLAAGFFAVT